MYHVNMYMGVFQEKNIDRGIYMRGSDSYSIITADALSKHQYSMEVF